MHEIVFNWVKGVEGIIMGYVYYVGNNLDVLRGMRDGFVDLIVTSPPYDNIRDYCKIYDVEGLAFEFFRVLRDGGVLLWQRFDQIVDENWSGTSFKEVLVFSKFLKFRDTAIFLKRNPHVFVKNRYISSYEYFFVFSKGDRIKFNGLKRDVGRGDIIKSKDYLFVNKRDVNDVWMYNVGFNSSSIDKEAYLHPAIFNENLVRDCVFCFTDVGDVVLDPFAGSGTALKVGCMYGRDVIGIDISEEYRDIAVKRLNKYRFVVDDCKKYLKV